MSTGCVFGTASALCALLTVSAVPVHAQAVRTPAAAAAVSDAEIATLIRFRVERQHRATGVVVGLWRPSGAKIVAYGAIDLKGSRQVDGDTIFEIASLTKVFTAFLLADAAVHGEVSINDPLSADVPAGVTVPAFEGRPITLTDLATHGSGLPLRPDNLEAMPDDLNKYAGYTLRQLYSGLPEYRLTRPPGSMFVYSNVGFALLGNALAFRLHTPWAELVRQRITAPLGMSDTALGINPANRSRLAQGYDIDLKPVGPDDEGALNPEGGLRSTANDLLRFLAAFLTDGQGRLPAAARMMLTVDRPGPDTHTRMALGWRRARIDGETFYWSNGGGDGSRTFMGFNPARSIAVVALANASSGEGVDDIAIRVLDPASPVDLSVPRLHHEISLSGAALDRLVGTYQFAPNDQIVIERGRYGLILTSGPGQLQIYPETPTRFFLKVADAQIDFDGRSPTRPTFLILRQDGQSSTYRRIP